jgi:hypothetical protein
MPRLTLAAASTPSALDDASTGSEKLSIVTASLCGWSKACVSPPACEVVDVLGTVHSRIK